MIGQKEGRQFEILFERLTHRQGIGILRINDGARRIPGFKKLIPVKQPCDWILAYNGKTAVIDTKTQAKGATFAHQKLDPNQIAKMMQLHEHGTIAGYIIWQRTVNRLMFIDVKILQNCLVSGLSCRLDKGLDLGSLEEPHLKRVFE